VSIPPVLSASAIPVVALSLLCKSVTGSGLPGPLGLVEGLAWITLPLGAGALLPRLGEIVKGGDFSSAAVLEILGRDARGAPRCALAAARITTTARAAADVARVRAQASRRRSALRASRQPPTLSALRVLPSQMHARAFCLARAHSHPPLPRTRSL
jgi:hypothetical protein